MSTKLYNAYRISKAEVPDIQVLFRTMSDEVIRFILDNKEKYLRLALAEIAASSSIPKERFIEILDYEVKDGRETDRWDMSRLFQRYLLETEDIITYSFINITTTVSFSWDYMYWYCVFFINDPDIREIINKHLDPMWDYHYQNSTDPSPTFKGDPHHEEYLKACDWGEEERWLNKNWYGRKSVWESILTESWSFKHLPTFDICSSNRFGWDNPMFPYGFMKDMKNPKEIENLVRDTYQTLKKKQQEKLEKLIEG